jgi:UDP-glucuronate 4-epimerase
MTVLVTGAAGFIGFHVATALIARGEKVVGIDNLDATYDPRLKQARHERLLEQPGFTFRRLDVSDREGMLALAAEFSDTAGIVHLAAQAGVRHSLTDPYLYVQSNVMGQVVVLELARTLGRLKHVIYASSSSVYGGNTGLPFAVDQPVEKPNSLYAATKRADELIAYTYAHLYAIPATGLRFFTVYGPWGRPDMAPMIFTRAILAGEPISVFNKGEMRRDFTYIDDIVNGVIRALDRPPAATPPAAIYNLGNHKSENLLDFIAMLERALGRKAQIKLEPMQPGDMAATFADIEASRRGLGFEPITPLSVGLPKFVAWYRSFYND